MPVYLKLFNRDGTEDEVLMFDEVRNAADLTVDPEDELLFLVHQGITWKVDASQGTLHERTTWERADTLARFRRAIRAGSAIVFKGRIRTMTPRRIHTYERIIRFFAQPPFVVADDPGIVLCLDGISANGP